MKPIFLTPFLQEKIWGGNKLNTEFGMSLPSEKTGEAWIASAHPNGLSEITFPKEYEGMTLDVLYEEKPELFGSDHPEPFPLLIKILDVNKDISVQVHPDNEYAQKYEGINELGKNECWYIISAEEDSKIIYGHNAQNKEEFEEYVAEGDFDGLLREIPVQSGDFFDVPAGTIHAIGAGVMILETQQSSDTTYRVYDYNRTDDKGHTRELHLEKSADVTLYPHKDSPHTKRNINQNADSIVELVSNDFFAVQKMNVDTRLTVDLEEKYYIVTVIDGEGKLNLHSEEYELKKGQAFIIPYGKKEITLKGNMELIFSSLN